jgi:hypothetical protein
MRLIKDYEQVFGTSLSFLEECKQLIAKCYPAAGRIAFLLTLNQINMQRTYFDNPKVDGIQLLERKYPQMTKRQVTQFHEFLKANSIACEAIKDVCILNPMAQIGEDFVFEVELKF